MQAFSPFSATRTAETSFGDKFQQVMQRASHDLVAGLVAKECHMADEVRSLVHSSCDCHLQMCTLIRARDWDLERLARECEAVVGESSGEGDSRSRLPQASLARVNEKIRVGRLPSR